MRRECFDDLPNVVISAYFLNEMQIQKMYIEIIRKYKQRVIDLT
jgi:hypothetical protein